MSDQAATCDVLNASAQGQLRAIIERIERLEEDKAAVATDIKEVYAEAKGNGFDTKILRKVVKYRKQDAAKRQEEEALLDLYLSAIGELPLFEGRAAAPARAQPPSASDVKVSIQGPDGLSIDTDLQTLKAATATLNRRGRGKRPAARPAPTAGEHRPYYDAN